jgi:hypothetical protein
MLNTPISPPPYGPYLVPFSGPNSATLQRQEPLSAKSHSNLTFYPLLHPQFMCIYKVNEMGYHSMKEGISLEDLQIVFSQGLIP